MGKRAAVLLLALLLAGCGGRPAQAVNLDGSTAISQAIAVLAEVFRQREPGISVNCSGSGSGAGIEGVLEGRCDIGLSSRDLTAEEAARGAAGRVLALDGVAVIVHPDNPISALTREKLADIFMGKITRWAELSGEDRPVAVYGREAGSGTRTAFEAALGVTDQCAYRNEYCSTGDIVGNVAANPNAIGYVSLASVNGTVKALAVDGIRCELDTVRNGTYPICRPFLLVTKEGAALSEAAGAFLDFAESEEAEPYLAMAGAAAPRQ